MVGNHSSAQQTSTVWFSANQKPQGRETTQRYKANINLKQNAWTPKPEQTHYTGAKPTNRHKLKSKLFNVAVKRFLPSPTIRILQHQVDLGHQAAHYFSHLSHEESGSALTPSANTKTDLPAVRQNHCGFYNRVLSHLRWDFNKSTNTSALVPRQIPSADSSHLPTSCWVGNCINVVLLPTCVSP